MAGHHNPVVRVLRQGQPQHILAAPTAPFSPVSRARTAFSNGSTRIGTAVPVGSTRTGTAVPVGSTRTGTAVPVGGTSTRTRTAAHLSEQRSVGTRTATPIGREVAAAVSRRAMKTLVHISGINRYPVKIYSMIQCLKLIW